MGLPDHAYVSRKVLSDMMNLNLVLLLLMKYRQYCSGLLCGEVNKMILKEQTNAESGKVL